MKDHEIILKMIEEVSPDDTKTLDEIDGRVWCYLTNNKFYQMSGRTVRYNPVPVLNDIASTGLILSESYTRSRDALKSIRPEGWVISYLGRPTSVHEWGFTCSMYPENNFKSEVFGAKLQTEELAELHAIIKAIAYERGASHE